MNKELAISILRGDVLGTNAQIHEAVFMAIKSLKAEPVVKCKDCILDREAQCPMKYATEPDDYCSFGERMDEVEE